MGFEGVGPGAAHISDPSFEGPRFKEYSKILNKVPLEDPVHGYMPSFTGEHMAHYNYNNHQFITPPQRMYAQKLKALYQNDPLFKRFADASRHYVHNNPAVVEASRDVLGMGRPIFTQRTGANWEGTKGWHISPVRLLDGKLDNRNLLPEAEAKAMAEDMLAAVREADEVKHTLYRGIWFHPSAFDLNEPDLPHELTQEALKVFRSLKPGDVIDLPLSSFSTKPEVSIQSFVQGDADKSFVLIVKGPKKAVNVQAFNSVNEFEWVSQGAFHVEEVIPHSSDKQFQPYTVITMTHKGVF